MKRFNSKAWTNIEQLHYFMSNQWSWDTSNTLQLFSELNHEDKKVRTIFLYFIPSSDKHGFRWMVCDL